MKIPRQQYTSEFKELSVKAVGDARFHERCIYELFEKRRDRAFVIVSHDPNFIKSYCTRAAVLDHVNLTYFEKVTDAFEHYSNDVLHRTGARK